MITIRWIHLTEDRHQVEIDESEMTAELDAAITAWKAGDRAPLDVWIDINQSDATFVKATPVPRAGVGVYTQNPTQEVSIEE